MGGAGRKGLPDPERIGCGGVADGWNMKSRRPSSEQGAARVAVGRVDRSGDFLGGTLRLFLFIIAAVAILLVTMLLAFGSSVSFGSGSGEGRKVRTEIVERRELVERVSAPGEIEPNVKVDVSAEVSARILELPFREGDLVKAGDVIIRLDAAAFEARLDSA